VLPVLGQRLLARVGDIQPDFLEYRENLRRRVPVDRAAEEGVRPDEVGGQGIEFLGQLELLAISLVRDSPPAVTVERRPRLRKPHDRRERPRLELERPQEPGRLELAR
jgi:hypothetical protein